MTESEILFDVKRMRTEKFENSELDASFVDSASDSEGPDRALDAYLASIPAGFFDCLFGEENNAH